MQSLAPLSTLTGALEYDDVMDGLSLLSLPVLSLSLASFSAHPIADLACVYTECTIFTQFSF